MPSEALSSWGSSLLFLTHSPKTDLLSFPGPNVPVTHSHPQSSSHPEQEKKVHPPKLDKLAGKQSMAPGSREELWKAGKGPYQGSGK